MDLRDRDLISIQEARDLVARAITAQKKFALFSQAEVDSIVEACASAGLEAAESLARRAVEETSFGNVPDKTSKNRFASEDVARAIRGMATVGIVREDRERGVLELASPIGVVAAIVPSTNPTSTTIYKTLISLKARNAVVFSPHPLAIRCICETSGLLGRAALAAGAPEGLIGCMQHTTLAGTRELMGHRDVGVILATGGTGLVRAAYASGKPAYGVGPGNVPAFIERTADVRKAVADIFAGKTFDYGTICSSEQAIVAEESVRELATAECIRQGGYFLSAEEAQRVGALMFLPGTHTPNTDVVGRPAAAIARAAGVSVPSATRVLIARLEPDQVGRAFPLSAEKLSTVLAFYSVANLAAGIELCTRLLRFGGLGHTCAIHSQNDAAIRQFGQAVPAFRVCVNTSAVHGAIGYSTNLFPAMTLGCGAPGGNITSDNIGPQHLMNIKRIAWESRGVEHRTVPEGERMSGTLRAADDGSRDGSAGGDGPAVAGSGTKRETIAAVVERVLRERGVPRGSVAVPATPDARPGSLLGAAPTPDDLPSPSLTPAQIAAEIAGRLFPDSSKASAAHDEAAVAAAAAEKPAAVAAVSALAPAPVENPPAPAATAVAFVSENDVRRALFRSEKIHIGPKTIVTPSARDLGNDHEIFVEIKV